MDCVWCEFKQGQEVSLFQIVQTGFGAHLASCSMGVGVRRPGRDDLPLNSISVFSAEVENKGSYASAVLICLRDVDRYSFMQWS